MNEGQEELTVSQEATIKPKRGGRRATYLICALLIVITVAVYWQVVGFDFVSLDDRPYVIQNTMVRMGLTPWSVQRAFILPWQDNYIPLVWLSYMVDTNIGVYVFGSASPGIYHVSNVVYHVADVLLLFALLVMLTGSRWKSAFVAALFAIHPLHVESVAWVAERKDVLSTLFWLLTMIAYVRYAKVSNTARFGLVVLMFALGLLAKPMLVTLPIVLLLIDFWPLNRMGSDDGRQITLSGFWRMVSEKFSLYVLTAVGCYITFHTQRTIGAVIDMKEFPLGVRLANAAVASLGYLKQMLWPTNLTFHWHPHGTLPVWQTIVSVLLLITITTLAVKSRRRCPYILCGWLWYLITLMPVVGIVQVGWQGMADRYTYVPLIGIFIILAWGIPDLLEKLRLAPDTANRLLAAASVVVIAALLPLTYRQVSHWQNSLTLWENAIVAEPTNPLAHYQVGAQLFRSGDYDRSRHEFEAALRLRPKYWGAMYGLAGVLNKQGLKNEAMSLCRQVIEIRPKHVGSHLNLAIMLMDKGKLDEAIKEYNIVLRLRPDNELAQSGLREAEDRKLTVGWKPEQ